MARSTPKPGAPVRGSRTGRPLMAAFDLLGRRWSLRILWELRDGPLGFRDLQDRCEGMSSSVLRDRLSELSEARLVCKSDDGRNQLTQRGSELGTAVAPLDAWARRWARSLAARPDGPEPC